MPLPRLRRSHLVALMVSAALVLWMLSGSLTGGDRQLNAEPIAAEEEPLTRVRVADLEPTTIEQEIIVSGRTEPARAVTLRAEIDARVVAVPVAKGARVAEGDPLVRLDTRDLEAELGEASALVEQRRLEYQAAQRLLNRNMLAETEMVAAKAKRGRRGAPPAHPDQAG